MLRMRNCCSASATFTPGRGAIRKTGRRHDGWLVFSEEFQVLPSKLTACLATAAIVGGVAAPSAMAQDTSVLNRQNRGFYIGGGVGANFLEKNKFERNGTDSTATYEPGLAGI